jgi:hypothetical protein
MKVCFATYDLPQIGGATIYLERLLPILRTAGVEPEVHAVGRGDKPGLHCTFLREQGIPVRWTPLLTHVPYAVRSFKIWNLWCDAAMAQKNRRFHQNCSAPL